VKKLFLLLVLAVALSQSGCPKDQTNSASNTGACKNSQAQGAGCSDKPVSVLEPSSFALLAAGLAAVGGLAVVLWRKRLAQN
jgi:outer membrane lipoprotein SlyB